MAQGDGEASRHGREQMGWTPLLLTASQCVPEWKCQATTQPAGASTMNITTIGIDLAKSVFQLHGTDERGKAVLSKVLRRPQMMRFFTQMPPSLISMEPSPGPHFWARKLSELGHTGKLMAPPF